MADNIQTVVVDSNDSNDMSIITIDFEGTQVTYDTVFDEIVYEDNEDASSYEPDI
jgi:hypothetical protein